MLVLSQVAQARQRRAGQLVVQLFANRVELPDAAPPAVVVCTRLIDHESVAAPATDSASDQRG